MKTSKITPSVLTGTKRIDVLPVFNERREPILYDIYKDGTWLGSRRTVDQVHETIRDYK